MIRHSLLEIKIEDVANKVDPVISLEITVHKTHTRSL